MTDNFSDWSGPLSPKLQSRSHYQHFKQSRQWLQNNQIKTSYKIIEISVQVPTSFRSLTRSHKPGFWHWSMCLPICICHGCEQAQLWFLGTLQSEKHECVLSSSEHIPLNKQKNRRSFKVKHVLIGKFELYSSSVWQWATVV